MRVITRLSGEREREQWGGSLWCKHHSKSLQVFGSIFTTTQGDEEEEEEEKKRRWREGSGSGMKM